MMQHTALILGLAAVFDLASANPRPVPGRSVAGETGCGAYGIYCNSADTFSLCVPSVGGTEYFFFGSVAPGTYCDESQERIRADNYGDCSPDGQIFCGAGGLTFFRCDQGGLINFGATAAGTECIDGQIVACNGPCGTDDGGPTTTVDPSDTTSSATIESTTISTPSTSIISTSIPTSSTSIISTSIPTSSSSIISTSTPTTFSTSSSSVSSTSSSTSSAAVPSTTTALGYFAAPADGNLLGGPVFYSPDMTTELCGSDCTGYTYFALLNGDTCNCGDTAPGAGSANPPTRKRQVATRQTGGCTPCSGDASECCGSPGYALVYEVTPAGQTPTVSYSSASSTSSVTSSSSTSLSVTSVPSISSTSVSTSLSVTSVPSTSSTSVSTSISVTSVPSTSSTSVSSTSSSSPSTSSTSSTSSSSVSSTSSSSSSSTSVTVVTSTSTATSSSSTSSTSTA